MSGRFNVVFPFYLALIVYGFGLHMFNEGLKTWGTDRGLGISSVIIGVCLFLVTSLLFHISYHNDKEDGINRSE